jgi:hypothetical protein
MQSGRVLAEFASRFILSEGLFRMDYLRGVVRSVCALRKPVCEYPSYVDVLITADTQVAHIIFILRGATR